MRFVVGIRLTAEDFVKQPRGQFPHVWLLKQPIPTYLGPIQIEILGLLDDRAIAIADELLLAVSTKNEEMLDKLCEHYERFSEEPDWMKSCGVPTGLGRKKLVKYLRSRTIVVNPRKEPGGRIFISPQWDTEIGISLGIVNGVFVFNPR